jgi:FdhD protein
MRTPGADRELAAGFLCTEGLVRSPGQILDLTRCEPEAEGVEPNVINVHLDPNHQLDWERLHRHTFASSSCGLCGKATIESVRQTFPPVNSGLTVDPNRVLDLPRRLRNAQEVFEQTGGLHAAGLFGPSGGTPTLFEDVGRHNAVDKLIGHCFLGGKLPLVDSILLLSGRVSFEVMQKALAAGLPVIAAISAPTSLAIQFAEENGQTLIGFLRPGRMNIYTHPERVRV